MRPIDELREETEARYGLEREARQEAFLERQIQQKMRKCFWCGGDRTEYGRDLLPVNCLGAPASLKSEYYCGDCGGPDGPVYLAP